MNREIFKTKLSYSENTKVWTLEFHGPEFHHFKDARTKEELEKEYSLCLSVIESVNTCWRHNT